MISQQTQTVRKRPGRTTKMFVTRRGRRYRVCWGWVKQCLQDLARLGVSWSIFHQGRDEVCVCMCVCTFDFFVINTHNTYILEEDVISEPKTNSLYVSLFGNLTWVSLRFHTCHCATWYWSVSVFPRHSLEIGWDWGNKRVVSWFLTGFKFQEGNPQDEHPVTHTRHPRHWRFIKRQSLWAFLRFPLK